MLSETVKFCNLEKPSEKGGGNGAGTSKKSVFVAIIIILAALISFGLGRLSKIRENKTPVTVENLSASALLGGGVNKISAGENSGNGAAREKLFVASKKGGKYHYPWCPGALRIKETNKIWFSTIKEAGSAGYTPAKNCKGLK